MSRENELLFIDHIGISGACIVCGDISRSKLPYEDPETEERGVVCTNCHTYYVNRDISYKNYCYPEGEFEL